MYWIGQSTFLFDGQNRLIEQMIGVFPCIGNTVLLGEIPLPSVHTTYTLTSIVLQDEMLHDCSTYVCMYLGEIYADYYALVQTYIRSEKPDDMHKAQNGIDLASISSV